MNPDESPLGYIKRLTQLNNYKTMSWLILGANKNSFGTKDFILGSYLSHQTWAAKGGFSVPCKYANRIRNTHLTQEIRFCPTCLKEGEYWRDKWVLKVSMCCTKHKVWLVDRCTKCGAMNRRVDKPFLHCRCGNAFSNNRVKACPENVHTMQCFLENRKLPSDCLMPSENNLTLDDKVKVIELVTRRVPNHRELRRGTNIHLNSIDLGRDYIVDAANTLFGGTEGFIAALKTLQAMKMNDSGICRLIMFYRDFYSRCHELCFEHYKQLLEQYVSHYSVRPLSRRNTLFREKAIQGAHWIALHHAVRKYKIPKSTITAAIDSGWIEAKLELKGDRYYTVISRPHLETRMFFIKAQMTAVEARNALGVTKGQFVELIGSGELQEGVTAPVKGSCSTWRIPEYTVETYLQSLLKGEMKEGHDLRPIQKLLQAWSGRYPKLFVTILRALKAGKVSYMVDKGLDGIRAIQVSESEALALMEQSSSEVFSIPRIAKVLNLSEEFVYQLANTGLLSSERGKVKNTRIIRRSNIESFLRQYAVLSKVTAAAGISSGVLSSYLKAEGVLFLNAGNIQFKQKIYLRSQLKDLAFLKEHINNDLDWAYLDGF
ncbi:TniQ family protein [Pseudoalteromonas maricaloris]